jgi:hypothetical protein
MTIPDDPHSPISHILDVLGHRRSDACRARVTAAVQKMTRLREIAKPNQIEAIAKTVASLEKQIGNLPKRSCSVFHESLANLQAIVATMKPVVGAAKRHLIPQKQAAADEALDLVVRWHAKPPSLTVEGPYRNISMILFEAATGRQNADMGRVCTDRLQLLAGSSAEYGRKKRAAKADAEKAPAYLPLRMRRRT